MGNTTAVTFGSNRTWVALVVLFAATAALAVPAAATTTDLERTAAADADEAGPTVQTAWADRLNETAFVAGANLSDLGDANEASVRIEYRENGTDDEWTTADVERVNSTETVILEVSGLEKATAYEYRAVAETTFGTDAGDAELYITPYDPPTVTTGTAVDVSETDATLTANVSDLAERPSMDVWFSYAPADSDEFRWNWNETETQTIDSPAVVRQPVTDLEPGTEYEFYVSVRDARGHEQYYSGDIEGFATASPIAVETGPETAVSATSATVTGDVVEFGDGATTWFEYGPAGTDERVETDPIAPNSAGTVETTLGDLEPGTTYEFRLVGEAADGETDAGSYRTLETAVDPVVETGSATTVDEESATVTAALTDLGGADAATVSVEYRAAGADEWSETGAQRLTEPGTLEATLPALEPDTAYEYRAVVDAGVVTETGAVETLTTDRATHDPTVETLSGSDDSPPNPHAELTADWRVADADGDLSSVTVTIESSNGRTVAESDQRVDGTTASGSLEESVKHGAGDAYTVTLEVVDDAGATVTETTTIDA
ncbi:fibronectin type III domain-containing protein [Halopiger djelfimassiliensis]|uniref:fibronectin type III domain-containing protein n=1 Tax=Halopiger djelfimassiliensis TaxID=1293047 RepID=UPI0006776F68|nr:fibronectin type III domain-containing protein [Halopiger djelfimassiliensis]